MRNVGQVERKTQSRIVKLFSNKLGYKYLGDWKDREDNSNIEKDYLKKYLSKKGYSLELSKKAIAKLEIAAKNQIDKLYYVNKEVYSMIRYGVQVKEDIEDQYPYVVG